MFCNKCGQQLDDHATVCSKCGAQQNAQPAAQSFLQTHEQPRCNACGHIGKWKVEPVFRPMDWVVGLVLMVLGIVPGLVYLGVTGALRSNKDRRAKICAKCKAKNMFTFQY